MDITYKPLTTDSWNDFTDLFGESGAGGCWCMYWRITRREFSENGNAGNKRSMQALVEDGIVPGIISYQDGKPVGWISIAPREDFASLERSRNLKRMDDQAVWSIVCFYVPRKSRGGMMKGLIEQAVNYARNNGAKIIEAYPSAETAPGSNMDHYMGKANAFLTAGFEVIEKRGAKLYMRKYLSD